MTAAFPPLQWSTEFKCGDPLIDQQHESLFNIVNRMIGAVNAGQDGESHRTPR